MMYSICLHRSFLIKWHLWSVTFQDVSLHAMMAKIHTLQCASLYINLWVKSQARDHQSTLTVACFCVPRTSMRRIGPDPYHRYELQTNVSTRTQKCSSTLQRSNGWKYMYTQIKLWSRWTCIISLIFIKWVQLLTISTYISMTIVITPAQLALVQGSQFDLLAGANLAFQIICVGLTSLFIVFCCIPFLHKRARSILRPWAVYHVENGLYWVALLQRYRKPLLTLLMEQSSQSVSVGFYVCFVFFYRPHVWC